MHPNDGLQEMQHTVHEVAVDKGFYEGFDETNHHHINTRLLLIISEVTEAMESLRKGDWSEFQEEMADVGIRLLDTCEALGVDLGTEIARKHNKNLMREYRHGGKRF